MRNGATAGRLGALAFGLLLACGSGGGPGQPAQSTVEAAPTREPACAGVPPANQATCPLLAPVVSLLEIPSGVRVELDSAAAAGSVLAHLRCRVALAAASRDGAPRCPLDGGISARPGSTPATIEIVGTSPEAVSAVRAAAEEGLVYTRAGNE